MQPPACGVQETLSLQKDDPKLVDSVATTRRMTNDVRPLCSWRYVEAFFALEG